MTAAQQVKYIPQDASLLELVKQKYNEDDGTNPEAGAVKVGGDGGLGPFIIWDASLNSVHLVLPDTYNTDESVDNGSINPVSFATGNITVKHLTHSCVLWTSSGITYPCALVYVTADVIYVVVIPSRKKIGLELPLKLNWCNYYTK